jgi:uncharacterized repeat protein (TIGR02543 family)
MKKYSWLLVLVLLWVGIAQAQSEKLTLTWTDNANNEDGNRIERGGSVTGPFSEVFNLVGANLVTWADLNLQQATEYCYRIRAYNAAGNSPYSNTACAVTPAMLTVVKAGTGSGTVASNPVGISCGTTCTIKFAGKSTVTLTATAAVASLFTGWSGACTGTGATCTVTMDAAKNVTATFAPMAVPAAPSDLVATPVLP